MIHLVRNKCILAALLMLVFGSVVTGCSLSDYLLNQKTDDETLYDLSDPNSELPGIEVGNPLDGTGGININVNTTEKVYIDSKTGNAITQTQYYANNITDAVKLYGLYITIPCFAIGFLIRRLVHTSAAVRKWGLVFELAIPFVYGLLAYGLSAIADNL